MEKLSWQKLTTEVPKKIATLTLLGITAMGISGCGTNEVDTSRGSIGVCEGSQEITIKSGDTPISLIEENTQISGTETQEEKDIFLAQVAANLPLSPGNKKSAVFGYKGQPDASLGQPGQTVNLPRECAKKLA